MGRETEVPDFALLPGRKKRLRGSGRRENLIDIFHGGDSVKLVEIHMIGVETLQGALQLLAGAFGVATRGVGATLGVDATTTARDVDGLVAQLRVVKDEGEIDL